ncbi:MAG: CesT family type III secretion system chaperone [Pseudomonadota bacterium]
MNKEMYCKFIDKVCEEFGVLNPEPMYEMCRIEVGSISFQILYGDVLEPNMAMLTADFGAVPAKQKTLILERMLETNLFTLGDNSAHFAFNRSTQHVVMGRCVPFTEVTVDGFKDILVGLAQLGSMWRKTYFLSPDELEKLSAEVAEV